MEHETLPPDPVIEGYKKDVDRTLIRENLKLTHDERLRNGYQMGLAAEEPRRAGQEMRRRQKAMRDEG